MTVKKREREVVQLQIWFDKEEVEEEAEEEDEVEEEEAIIRASRA